ncbi:hypothetical protein DASC09_050110 [Saccharomycopsis crataegensis]|uniref:Uncharacterized protein n=1 Tax=Saccharomycopsis crataegensis TaxID=43959 RepID=A0AAV5QT33_9ASCO|nr:hypothetical protein DASC09_050110 [Saccharomycopsis crataegensis]
MRNFLVLRENQDVTYLKNHDVVPMPISRRIWGFWTFLSFYSIGNVSVATWSAGSSLLSIGINVGEIMGCIVIGNIFICLAYFFVSAPGYDFHVGYTMLQRVIFGIRGCYLGILIRILLSIVWYASDAWMGGLILGNIFSSWSSDYFNLTNTFSESVPFSRKDLIGFVLFQLIQLPFFLIRPEKLRFLIHVGCVTCFFSMLGLTIWAVALNGGDDGPLMDTPNTLAPSAHGWAWISGVTSWYGSLLTGIVNSSDYTRFSKNTRSSWAGVPVGNLVMGTVIPLMGLATASALDGKYDEQFWTPSQIMDQILTNDYSPKARAAVFFCAFGVLTSQLAINVVGNGISGGTDIAGLLPKFFNIRRGAIATALLSWAACPWLYYNSSSNFYLVMSAFSVFLSPFVGIIVCEHWIKRKRTIKLSDLYTFDSDGIYYYTKGFNWQNIIIWIIGFAPGVPGLVKSVNTNAHVNSGIINYFQGNSLFGFCISFFLCYISGLIFPSTVSTEIDEVDEFDTFTEQEAADLGVIPYDASAIKEF